MQLVSFTRGAYRAAGVLRGNRLLGLEDLGFSDARSFIAAGDRAKLEAERRLRNSGERDLLALHNVHLIAPIPNPGKILCIGLNYRDHAIESKMQIPAVPTVFPKLASAIVGPEAPVVLPPFTSQVDYEGEFAVVIGRAGSRIPQHRWKEHVFGYTILNDVSARDIQLATSQWTLGKSLNTFAPMGPHIITRDEIDDPSDLEIRTTLNGETVQQSRTSQLIFGIPELIEYISRIAPLEPGDIISTGTPAGVGMGRTPQRWLRHGDEVAIEIEGIGVLRNPVAAETETETELACASGREESLR